MASRYKPCKITAEDNLQKTTLSLASLDKINFVPLPVSVNECIECQSISPACGEIGHSDVTIPTHEDFTS